MALVLADPVEPLLSAYERLEDVPGDARSVEAYKHLRELVGLYKSEIKKRLVQVEGGAQPDQDEDGDEEEVGDEDDEDVFKVRKPKRAKAGTVRSRSTVTGIGRGVRRGTRSAPLHYTILQTCEHLPMTVSEAVAAFAPGSALFDHGRFHALFIGMKLSFRGVQYASEDEWAEALVPLTVGPHVEAGMWPRVSEMMIERTEDLVRRFVRREVMLSGSQRTSDVSEFKVHVQETVGVLLHNEDWRRLKLNRVRGAALRALYMELHPAEFEGLSAAETETYFQKNAKFERWLAARYKENVARNRLEDLVYFTGPLMFLCPPANIRTLGHSSAGQTWKTVQKVHDELRAMRPEMRPIVDRFEASVQMVLAFTDALVGEPFTTQLAEFIDDRRERWMYPVPAFQPKKTKKKVVEEEQEEEEEEEEEEVEEEVEEDE